MRIIALIDDPGVVRRILEHLGPWAPEATGRDPPAQVPAREQRSRREAPSRYRRRSRVNGRFGFLASSRTSIRPGVCPILTNRASRRPSAS